jgi:hypothetical protein
MPDVTIEIDGRTFSGSFNVLGKTITASSASLGTKTAVLRNLPPLQEFEPPRQPRRLFGLSHAAIACSCMSA